MSNAMIERVSGAIARSQFNALEQTHSDRAVIECERFVARQIGQMPDYLRCAFAILAHAVNLFALATEGGGFCRISVPKRERVIARLERLSSIFLDFITAYRTLTTFYFCSIMNDGGGLK